MNNLAENLFISFIVILVTPMIFISLLLSLTIFIVSKITKSHLLQKYSFNLALSVDQHGNVLLLGDPDETISSRLGRAKQSKRPKLFATVLGWFVNLIFRLLIKQEDHILESVEYDKEYPYELWSWIKEEDNVN